MRCENQGAYGQERAVETTSAKFEPERSRLGAGRARPRAAHKSATLAKRSMARPDGCARAGSLGAQPNAQMWFARAARASERARERTAPPRVLRFACELRNSHGPLAAQRVARATSSQPARC